MMVAGSWQPTTFLRFVKPLPTSTRVAEIVTDAGGAFIKALGNPCGPHVLACEWVATHLARWFGLPTFEFAIMRVEEVDEIPLGGGCMAQPGPAFVTKAIEGHPWGGSQKELEQLVNPESIPRLVVFDTWILNKDRHPPEGTPRGPHKDNVFLCDAGAGPGKLRLLAIDHSHCFAERPNLTRNIARIDAVQDRGIYGLFPEFIPWISKREVAGAAHDLGRVGPNLVWEIVRSIPKEWDVNEDARDALKELICQRAAFLSREVVQMLDAYYPRTEGRFDWNGKPEDTAD